MAHLEVNANELEIVKHRIGSAPRPPILFWLCEKTTTSSRRLMAISAHRRYCHRAPAEGKRAAGYTWTRSEVTKDVALDRAGDALSAGGIDIRLDCRVCGGLY